ncbi:MAG: SDR family NAD(P)-dependent oxidoreductase [Trebonia sp.]
MAELSHGVAADFTARYGPVAVVTGASSGIGYAFAEELASRGLDLVVTARRLDRLGELADRLTRQHGVKVTAHQSDLADPAAPQGLLELTGGMDVGLVISNAGFGLRRGRHETHSAATLTTLLMLNCNAPSALAHGFIPRLRARGRGGIIFTSSVEGAMGGPYSAAYSASKALVNALGEALWGELAETEIDVLTLCPGKTVSEAAIKQGFAPSTLDDAMPARDVARLALAHIKDGPTYISSEHYATMIEQMSALPRRQTLLASAAAMKKHMAARDA